jgi:hypothetical protein
MTEGGTTSGYSEMGRFCMAIRPPMRITLESTPAKIGRSMKNREMFMRGLSGFFSGSISVGPVGGAPAGTAPGPV